MEIETIFLEIALLMKATAITVLIWFISQALYAQCTPNASFNAPGNHTTAGEGKMNSAEINSDYSETITVIPPVSYDTFGLPIAVDSIRINGVLNLPDGLSFSIGKKLIKRGKKSCISIVGKPTSNNNLGEQTITLDLTYFANRGSSIKHPKNMSLELKKEPEDTTTGILQSPVLKQDIRVFPNPNNGNFIVDVGDLKEATSLEILDLRGMIVFESTIESQKIVVKLDQPAGAYFLRMYLSQSFITQRILIQ